MATCINSIGSGQQLIEMNSGSTSRINIGANNNALFSLNNELDQSVFFNIKTVGYYSSIAVTMTIYNALTLIPFGSLNISQSNTSTSFSITSGQYIICFRPTFGSFILDVTPTFISYNNVASFNSRSYYGTSSIFTLNVDRPIGVCTRRLLYTVIDGELPNGLTMLDNGYVIGNLPILDCDSYNDGLPTSNTWYHKISDSEYVTSWGRAYRFKVRLTLYDDRSKEDDKWFYISIINNFSKNIALVDKYGVLEDSKVATFESKIKLDLIDLCAKSNGTNVEVEKSNDEKFFDLIEENQIDPNEPNLFEYNSDYKYVDNQDLEYIEFNESTNNFDLISYFKNNYNNNDVLVESLKDSPMFNAYMLENDMDESLINNNVIKEYDYVDISYKYDKLNGSSYIVFKNNSSIESSTIDTLDKFEENYEENYKKLPLTTYSIYGWYSTFKLFKDIQ